MISKTLTTSILVFSVLFIMKPIYSKETDQNKTYIETVQKKHYPHPIIAGLYSMVIPGGGYFYNGDFSKGALAAPLTIPLLSYYYITTDSYTQKSIKVNTLRACRDIHFYTIFDAYQDAVDANPEYKPVLPIRHATPFEAYTAPFNINNYSFGSLLVLPIPLCSLVYSLRKKGVHSKVTAKRLSYAVPLLITQAVIIGVGEEYFSRGFMFSTFSQITGSRIAGGLIQAADFGARHTGTFASRGYNAFPYGLGTVAFYTNTIDKNREYYADESESEDAPDSRYFVTMFLFGLYMGLLTATDNDGILEAIALHATWDAILFIKDLLVYGNTGTMYLEISVPYHF